MSSHNEDQHEEKNIGFEFKQDYLLHLRPRSRLKRTCTTTDQTYERTIFSWVSIVFYATLSFFSLLYWNKINCRGISAIGIYTRAIHPRRSCFCVVGKSFLTRVRGSGEFDYCLAAQQFIDSIIMKEFLNAIDLHSSNTIILFRHFL